MNQHGFTPLETPRTVRRSLTGFTLIEAILYLVIASVVAVLLIQGTVLIGDMRQRYEVAAAVSDEAALVLGRIAEQTQRADIVAPAPGGSSATLLFDDGVTMRLVDGVFMRQTATRSDALTSSEVVVSNVQFENLGSGTYDIVRTELTVAFAAPASAPAVLLYERTYVTSTKSRD